MSFDALIGRAKRFATRPYLEQRIAVGIRWARLFPRVPFPVRLPWGWWLARNDVCSREVLWGRFEEAEVAFVSAYLRSGMTVLDIGAHHGFYTLLAAHKVSASGRVIAFEPSPREGRFLRSHLRLNRCKNVSVQPFALGSSNTTATLFLVDGADTGCNSLRKPNVNDETVELNVRVRRLDDVLAENCVTQVDFVKLDAEGGELEILKGASNLVSHSPRPAFLVEVQDIRTQPWGYAAREIIAFLEDRGYAWFALAGGGKLVQFERDVNQFNGNFVAVPSECMKEVTSQHGV